MPKFDADKFNTDPKNQEQRDFLDKLVENSVKRIVDAKKKQNPQPDDVNIFDQLFGGGQD